MTVSTTTETIPAQRKQAISSLNNVLRSMVSELCTLFDDWLYIVSKELPAKG